MVVAQRLQPAEISDRNERNLARTCTQCDKRKRGFSGHAEMPCIMIYNQGGGDGLAVRSKSPVLSR